MIRSRRPERPVAAQDRPFATAGAFPLLELRFDYPPSAHPFSEVFRREGAEPHLVACRLTERGPPRLLRWLDVRVPEERASRLVAALRRRVGNRNLAAAKIAADRVLLRVREPAPPLCIATYRAGGICVACPLLSRRPSARGRVVLPSGARTRFFLRHLPEGEPGRFAVTRPKPAGSEPSLTARQDRALRVAYERGYFDYPRRADLAEVARALGTGRSATLELLRRAISKLAVRRYGDELGDRGAL